MFSSVTFPFIFLRLGLSEPGTKGFGLDWLASKDTPVSAALVLRLQASATASCLYYRGARNPN